jgi:hypothetical protein
MEEQYPDTPLARQLFPTWFAHEPLLTNMSLLGEDLFDFYTGRVGMILQCTNID